MTLNAPRTLKIAFAAVALAVAGAAVSGGTTPAEAKKLVIIKKHVHHNHGYRRYYGPAIVLGGVAAYAASHSCYWMKVRAINRNSAYWWNRYNECRGE